MLPRWGVLWFGGKNGLVILSFSLPGVPARSSKNAIRSPARRLVVGRSVAPRVCPWDCALSLLTFALASVVERVCDLECVLRRCVDRRFWAKDVGRLGFSVRSEMVLRTRGSRVKYSVAVPVPGRYEVEVPE